MAASIPETLNLERLNLLNLRPYIYIIGIASQLAAQPTSDWTEFLADPTLSRGVELLAPRAQQARGVKLDTLRLADGHGAPRWHLCQWNFRQPLQRGATPTPGRFGQTYQTPSLLFARDAEGVITLGVQAGEEYASPRKQGQEWPNLLIETTFDSLRLSRLSQLEMQFEVRLLWCRNLMSGQVSPDIHTAQSPFYFLLRNRNPQSQDYKSTLWLGVFGFDWRYDRLFSEPIVSWDEGTRMYIYQIPGTETWQEQDSPFTDGLWHHARVDVLTCLRQALDHLRGRGLFAHTRPEDLQIEEMNFGWETPGTFDCAIQIRGLSLRGQQLP